MNGLAKNMKDNTIVTAFRPVVTETGNVAVINRSSNINNLKLFPSRPKGTGFKFTCDSYESAKRFDKRKDKCYSKIS